MISWKEYLVIALVALGTVCFLTWGFLVWNHLPFCSLEGSWECFGVEAGADGFQISLVYTGDEAVLLDDLIISRVDGQLCDMPRMNFQEPDLLEPERIVTYFVSREHPDGACLFEGTDDFLEYEVRVLYTSNEGSKTVVGSGQTSVSEEIILESQRDLLVSE